MKSLFVAHALVLLSASGATAPQAESPETVVVEKGPFSVVHELKGTFDAPDALEVLYRGEVYKGILEVAEAVAPGPVTKGQTLVRFQTEKIDEQIKDATIELEIARTNLQRLSEEAKRKEEASAIELESAEMRFQRAEQTLETFREVLMPMRIAEAELGLQSSKDRLMEQEEQFEQLLKMYKSDDLVEETEEIVLRREKRSLEQGRARMKFTLRRHELQTTVDIPRELRGYEFELRKSTNSFELAKATSKLRLEQSVAELQKAKLALARKERSFERLEHDREALTLKAPEAGIAVPGQLVRGKWTRLEENARVLRAGEKAQATQVLFTIVQRGPKTVRTTVPESVVLQVAEGQDATVAPAATPGEKLGASVVGVARVSADGKFCTWLEVTAPDSRLLAGHTATIRLTTSTIAEALTVPATAVAKDGDRSIVHLWENGEAQVREVRTGATSEGRTLILSGLKAGDSVLEQVPAGEAK